MSRTLDEHSEYLALRGRYELFQTAFDKVIQPGHIVADLGCGFGVLGIQCLRAGAARVYGVDYSDAVEIARETVARAGLTDKYHCIRGSTFHLELPEPVDAIVCDHVGHMGIDYGIVEMLGDARRLLKKGGAVVPRRIELMIAGASSTTARNKADAWTQEAIPAEFAWLHDYQVNSKHPYTFAADELCTPPVPLGSVDLLADNPDYFAFSGELVALRNCRLDGLAVWFRCELAHGVWMTNSPIEPARIDRDQAYLPCASPIKLRAGDRVEITLRFRGDGEVIAWTITPPDGGPRQKLSTWNSKILTSADLAAESLAPPGLNRVGRARFEVLQLVDGERTASEIEEAALQLEPKLFPSETAVRRFVKRELRQIAEF